MCRWVIAALLILVVWDGHDPIAAQRDGGPGGSGPVGSPGGGPNGGFARGDRQQASGTALIRGRIVSAETGTPLRRAQIRAQAREVGASRLATTDGQGRFELRDLPAARWTVTASKAGFVTIQYGQRRPFESGRAIELSVGQAFERADIALPRGSAITGRLYDEFGDPVAGVRVQVLRYQTIQGAKRLTPVGAGDQTDDLGSYRLFGLAPGEYFVSATLRAGPAEDGAEPMSYAPTYYPGTGNLTEAQRVTIGLAQEQANVNFSLLPVRVVKVSGTAIDSSGNPLANAQIALMSAADVTTALNIAASAGRTRSDGSFVLTNVAPGSYTLNAGSAMSRRGSSDAELASMPIVIGNEDLTGITVVTTKGATITGRVVTADANSPELNTNALQVTAQSTRVEAGPFANARPVRVDGDGTFQLTGLIGSRLLRVSGLPQDWMLESITVNDVDVTDAPLELRGDENIGGVQIVVTNRVTEVNGRVTLRGSAARDYAVVVFAEDASKWKAPSRYVRTARPDEQGTFSIRGIPAGERYLVVAVDALEDGEGSDPDFLEQIKTRATPFTIGAAESKALELKLVQR